jgi:hypothetical protein
MSASRLEDVWEDREAAGSAEADACELMGQLSNGLVGVAAALARLRRRLPAADAIRDELGRVDEAFATPIALARKLAIAIHASHDCSRPSRAARR